MSFPAARWRPNRASRGTSAPTPGAARPMLVTVGTGGSAAREARPVSTGAELHCDRTATAGVRRKASMRRMSTKPGTQNGAVPPETAADAAGTADASPPDFLEQIYEQATARLAAIIDEWQKARDACLRG